MTAPDGTRIEVKSGAYLRAWNQRGHSKIVFSGLRAKTWTPETGYTLAASYNADVYVFAVQSARTHDAYNALDPERWEYWVAPQVEVAATGQESLALSRVRALWGEPLRYKDLAVAVHTAARHRPDASETGEPTTSR